MADAMTGQVDETIKNQRSEKLIGIEKELEKEYRCLPAWFSCTADSPEPRYLLLFSVPEQYEFPLWMTDW